MNYLRNLKWEMVIFSILSIIMGALMFFFPNTILTAVCIILASILFIIGIGHMLEYRRRDSLEDFYKYELVVGAIFIIAGIMVLIFMKSILSIITYAIAIVIIFSGLMKMENAFDLKKMRSNWIPLMAFAIICILLGISVLLMPMNHNDSGSKTAGDFAVQCTGVIFAVSGLIDLITTLSVSGKIKSWTVERNANIAHDDVVNDSEPLYDEDEIVEDGETGEIIHR